jgi:ribonuclease D
MEHEYIDTPDRLAKVVQRLAVLPLLGVDTEAAGYHRYLDRLSLVQMSSREENFLIDPLAIADLSPLGTLFSNPAIEKIFHDADYDLRILHRDLALTVSGLFDTQIAAAFLGEKALGLGALVQRFVGPTLPKAFQRADWAERPLSDGMKEYAATDTAYLPALRDRLREELIAIGRLAWAEEEFERREHSRWGAPADEREAFLRVKGARDLTPRGLAVLRELYDWRETVAQERDQATFRVLANQTMLELSLKAPANARDLGEIRGVGSGLLERRGAEMLAAVRRGLAIPEEDLPRFPQTRRWDRDPDVEMRAERLRAIRSVRAQELDLDPGFLMSRALLDEVARRNPASVDELLEVPDIRRWQVEALGQALVQSLRG